MKILPELVLTGKSQILTDLALVSVTVIHKQFRPCHNIKETCEL
jgi:hypothetical protein